MKGKRHGANIQNKTAKNVITNKNQNKKKVNFKEKVIFKEK